MFSLNPWRFVRFATILAAFGALSLYAVLVLVDPAGAVGASPSIVAEPMATATAAASPVSSTGVVLPWGTWVGSILAWLRDIALAGGTALIAKYVSNASLQAKADTVLANAIDYGQAAVEGIVKGKTVTLPQAQAWMTMAEQYVVANAPALASKLAATLRPKILARISSKGVLPESTPPGALGATLPAA